MITAFEDWKLISDVRKTPGVAHLCEPFPPQQMHAEVVWVSSQLLQDDSSCNPLMGPSAAQVASVRSQGEVGPRVCPPPSGSARPH